MVPNVARQGGEGLVTILRGDESEVGQDMAAKGVQRLLELQTCIWFSLDL